MTQQKNEQKSERQLIAKTRTILVPQNYGPHIKKILKYDFTNPARTDLVDEDNPCDCKKGPIKK